MGREPLVIRVEDTEAQTQADHGFRRSPVRLGRNPSNDLVAPQPFVSSWHGLIEFDERGVRYTDLGSTNGSVVDGQTLAPRSPAPICAGSEVLIGSLRVTFLRAEAPRGAASATAPFIKSGEDATAGSQAVQPGSITALMRELARAPVDLDPAWHQKLRPGATIGHFELVQEIGRGGFGVVFEARDRRLGRPVAFKVVRPGRSSQIRLREDRLQKEAEAVAQLAHPNIVTLYDVGSCESGPYLIFELLRGETLAARMRRGPIAPPEALDIAIEVAWALEYAHRVGVVHRDLKPSNVMLCQQGMVKILDFGIAHMLGETNQRVGGSPPYMAPEQWRGQVQDTRTDVFGAAAMLFESLSGRLPYRATRAGSSALEPGARPDVDGARLDPELGQLLLRALSPDPEARPCDGHDWLAALLQLRERAERPLGVPKVIAPRR